MRPCLHIDARGRHCREQAEPDSPFCFLHEGSGSDEVPLLGPALRKLLFRLVAGLLLLLFALQGYQFLKAVLTP